MILDNVLIPWEDILFYQHTRAAAFIRQTLHRYSAFPFVQRTLSFADLMIGAALWNTRQTGLEKQQAVQEKLAELAVWREGINAHLTAAIATGEKSPNGLLMPNQSLLMTGRVHALSNLPRMIHLARELCGGQICVTPDAAAFENPETAKWLQKYLHDQRRMDRRGPPQTHGFRPRSPQFGLCRPPPDLPTFCPGAPVRAFGGCLSHLRLERPARIRAEISGSLGSHLGRPQARGRVDVALPSGMT